MNTSRAGRTPDLWIVENPWLRDAFRQSPVERGPQTVPAAPAETSAARALLDLARTDDGNVGDPAGCHP